MIVPVTGLASIGGPEAVWQCAIVICLWDVFDFFFLVFQPVQGFDVARHTEQGVSGMKTTAFMSTFHPPGDNDEEAPIPVKRETSLRRKVQKRPIQKPPVREPRQ